MQQPPRFGLPAGNPLANALVIIVGIAAITISIVVGFFAFMALSAIVLVAALILWIRVWWLRRGVGSRAASGDIGRRHETSPEVIEGEYKVVRRPSNEP